MVSKPRRATKKQKLEDTKSSNTCFTSVKERLTSERKTPSANKQYKKEAQCPQSDAWQVIQIVEKNAELGEYKMWIKLNNEMRAIQLTIPRSFYLNCKDSDPELIKIQNPSISLEKSTQILPRSHTSLNIFQVTMPEKEFQAEQAKTINIFNQDLTAFETRVPLLVRAVLKLGCACWTESEQDQVDLSELNSIDNQSLDYFSKSQAFDYIYFFHVHQDSIEFFALVGATLSVSQIYIVGEQDDENQAKRVYEEMYNEMIKENKVNSTVEILETMEFETSHYSNEQEAFNAINLTLSRYKDTKEFNTIIAINSQMALSNIVEFIPMISEFPYLKTETTESNLNRSIVYSVFLTQLFDCYMNLGTFIDQKLSQARYSNIPFCNIPKDASVYMSDILFARELIKNNMVIWWSDTNSPDTGDMDKVVPKWNNPEINNSGAYDSICAEFDVSNLCIHTLLTTPLIHNFEKKPGSRFGYAAHMLDKKNQMIDSNNDLISQETLNVLRSIVYTWMEKSISEDNKVCNNLISTSQRWLISPDSSMYDPILYKTLHSLMKKVFNELVSELKRLGITIVYASFHRIMITSDRDTAESAVPFFQTVYQMINIKKLFRFLNIKHRCFWDVILWMDEWNFAGVLVDDYKKIPHITKHWSIEQYLPKGAVKKFTHYTSMYLATMAQGKHKYPDNSYNRSVYLQEYVTLNLRPKISNWINTWIAKPVHVDNAVEFIKLVFGVLNLDSRGDNAMTLLKRDLLKSTANLSDFSERAQFINPINYYKLPDICCFNCDNICDFDIIRDPSINPNVEWNCESCNTAYSWGIIEMELLQKVQEILTMYQNQKLRCVRCKKTKSRLFQKHCDRCGGTFEETMSKRETKNKIQAVHTISKEYKFQNLEDYVNHIIKNIN